VLPEAVLQNLICPVCGGGLIAAGQALRCDKGHSFDIARQGYVNLLAGRKPAGTADTAAMIAARTDFLDSGFYQPVVDAVADEAGTAVAASALRDGMVVDVGAGTGHYLAHTLERLPSASGLAVDVSVPGLRRAARAHPRAAAVGADVWRGLPIRTGTVAAVLDVFAPRNAEEFHRILRPEGVLVVVTPLPGHLNELVHSFGMITVDARKEERVEQALTTRFRRIAAHELTFPMRLGPADVDRLIRMGPSAHHVAHDALDVQLRGLADETVVTASVLVSVYRPSE
jgi:23S rRNA (guanine745-N1)-methyltransferase